MWRVNEKKDVGHRRRDCPVGDSSRAIGSLSNEALPHDARAGVAHRRLSHWEFGRFELYRVNPPLVRMVAALPVMAAGYEEDWSGFYESPGARPVFSMGSNFIAANGERSIWLFTIARWACIPFAMAGGLFTFFYSRELWGTDYAGLLSLAIWCFEPNILAHAELITNDVPCTAFGIGATWLFWRWLKSPTWGRAGIAGLVFGIAQLTKSSWLILFGLWPILWILWELTRRNSRKDETERTGEPQLPDTHSVEQLSPIVPEGGTFSTSRWTRATQLILLLLIGLYILNLGYAFDGSFTRLGKYEFISQTLTGLEESGDVGTDFARPYLPTSRSRSPSNTSSVLMCRSTTSRTGADRTTSGENGRRRLVVLLSVRSVCEGSPRCAVTFCDGLPVAVVEMVCVETSIT